MSLSLVLGTEGLAQRASQPTRKKPFEEFSQSAQRLKDSVAVLLTGEPIDVSVDTTGLGDLASDLAIVTAARSQLGTRYRLGAERPGKALDCSALVRYVMAALRIDLPRTAREQASRGTSVEKDVSRLRPGDLLTFGRGSRVSHIGVYIGEGRFVHASTSRRQVVESSIDRPGTWYRRNWVGVRRLLASAATTDTLGSQ